MRVAVLQMTSTAVPGDNAAQVTQAIAQAADQGADWVMTPEVTNCLSSSRAHQARVLRSEDQDQTLAAARAAAAQHGIWVLLGSIALAEPLAEDTRFVNRSILIDDAGQITARYDKIHMFDVTVSETETYRESAGYRPGTQARLAQTPWGAVGLTICYDVRFPSLYRDLAQAGARFLTVPSAFSRVTGAAHWEVLLRARAIETGCFVLAPAQTGRHDAKRATYGHSMVVAPWGEVLLDAGTRPGLYLVDLDPEDSDKARTRIPALGHDRPYDVVI